MNLLEKQRITVEPSPYTYVRTIVMRSNLFSRQDYEKMLKMELPEIIQFLEESTYKREIDELAVSEDGVTLVEHAVNRNFRRAVEKLQHISGHDLRILIDVYLWRNDIQNIKTILRAKHSSQKADRVGNLFLPGTLKKAQLLKLFELGSVEEIIRAVKLPFTTDLESEYKERGLSGVESDLTKRYFHTTLDIASRIKEGGEAFKEFLQLEVDIVNITTILKLKREGANADRINRYIIRSKATRPEENMAALSRRHLIEKLLQAENIDECFTILRTTPFRHAVAHAQQSYEQTGSLIDLERHLQLYLLKHTKLLSHKHPLSVDIVLSYLFAKVNEIRNVFMLIKGKQLGVPESFLEQELVM